MNVVEVTGNKESTENNDKKIFNNVPAIIFELVSFLSVFIVCFLFFVNTFNIEPFHRGFFCDDQSLMFPYKDDTISTNQIIAVVILIFPGTALIVEPLYITTCMKGTGTRATLRTLGKSFYSLVMIYLLGGGLTQVVVTVAKLTVGRLRPNFFAWCVPGYNFTDCSVGSGYILDYICANNDTDAVMDVKQSFPSRHASSAAYAFVYVAIYLDIRLRQQLKWKTYFRVIAPAIQTLLVIAGTTVCVSRIQDNQHHPTDVIGGVVIGIVASLVTCLVWSRDSLKDWEENTPSLRPNTQKRNEPYTVNNHQYDSSTLLSYSNLDLPLLVVH